MIELLGIGVPRARGEGWLLHRVCAQIESGELTMVVSRDPAERLALLDAVAGRRLPDEGRVYIGRVPITRETNAWLQARVAEADLSLSFVESRSVLWNTLAARGPGLRALLGFLRLPRPRERQAALRALARVGLRERASETVARLDREGRARLVIARELARQPEHLIAREVDAGLDVRDSGRLLTTLGTLAHSERVGILASAASWTLARAHADRVLGIAEGLLVYDGQPIALADQVIARRLGIQVPTTR